MTEDTKPNLRCSKCRAQTECSNLNKTLSEMRCGLNGGHIDDSCKVNLALDGKAVFGIKQIINGPQKSKDTENTKKNEIDSDAKKE